MALAELDRIKRNKQTNKTNMYVWLDLFPSWLQTNTVLVKRPDCLQSNDRNLTEPLLQTQMKSYTVPTVRVIISILSGVGRSMDQ